MINKGSLKQKFNNFILGNKDDSDKAMTKTVIKSSAISFVAKVVNIFVTLFTIPLVYNALDKYQFGIYATLTSIIAWIDLFDFGITQGLRNRLTEARVDGNIKLARKYISTSYCLLSLIAGSLLVVYFLFFRVINWQTILNAPDVERDLLDNMAFVVFCSFLVRLVVSIINKIYYAFQKAYMVDVTQLIGKILYLAVLIVLSLTNGISLFNVAVLQSTIAAVVPIVATVHFLFFLEPSYKPSFRLIDFSITNQILGLGVQFFIIQVALLIIHSGNNLLISQFVDPASVPAYSLTYQLFSYMLLAYTIIITPMWSAYTEAWRKGNIDWIQQTMARIKKIFIMFVIGSFVVVAFTPLIFRLWIGNKADVPIMMAAAVATMILLDMYIRIYDFFINGVGKIRVQMIVNITMAVLNIPMAYLFSVILELNAVGVVIASIVSYSISAVVSPMQAKMILNGTAKGLWNK